MTMNQAIAQSEYTSQHCDKEWINYYETLINNLNELKDLRSKIKDLNGRIEKEDE